MSYTKQKHIDHIVNQEGQVIQQGTPYSAGRLNNMEGGIAGAHVMADNNVAAVRDAIASGLSKFGNIDYTYMKTNANKIKLTGGAVALVNGYKIDIADGTIVTLDAPPEAGEREDLVFLEVYRAQQTDNQGDLISSRIRVVSGVDFKTYFNDGFCSTGTSWEHINRKVTAQGGNAAPIAENANNSMSSSGSFIPAIRQSTFAVNNLAIQTDYGLYVTGNGTQAAKDFLKTADGYVYAIPLFRLKRRNTASYSANNPNGANLLGTPLSGWPWGSGVLLTTGISATVTVPETDYNRMEVGHTYALITSPNYRFTVLSKNGANSVTVVCSGTSQIYGTDLNSFYLVTRPDLLKSDIIDERDILDLRRQTRLTGYDYQAIFEESMDRLQRGELQTKERKRMVKTYHGLRKNPVDANTLFYLSGDNGTAEVGTTTSVHASLRQVPSPTGAGIDYGTAGNVSYYKCGYSPVMTIDFLQKHATNFLIRNKDQQKLIYVEASPSVLHYRNYKANGEWTSVITQTVADKIQLKSEEWKHVRLVINFTTMRASAYINGYRVMQDAPITNAPFGDLSELEILVGGLSSGIMPYNPTIGATADLMISNIDRGGTFATLPADVIAGYAKIAATMNGQRKVHSDAISAQYTLGIAKGIGTTGQSKGITKTQATPDTWAQNDTLKVKGLAGSSISGVIDADTVLSRIVAYKSAVNTTPYTVTVDTVTGLAVSDVVTAYSRVNNSVLTAYNFVVQSISGNDVTLVRSDNGSAAIDLQSGQYETFVEVTANTSSPVVKFMNAGTLTTVTGTWSGLGTNEATFTLGVNAALVNADLQLEYSLNNPVGQAGTPEVYTATLAGEVKGKKLVIGTVAVKDDFVGKVSGSATENPNLAKKKAAATLQAPVDFATEFDQAGYDSAEALDGTTTSMTTSVNGEIAQQLFSFDLVKMVEAKYGPIPSVDKVGWVKTNINIINVECYCYGVGPNGNKAKIGFYRNQTGSWLYGASLNVTAETTAATAARLTFNTNALSEAIDASGLFHIIAIADASNGVTASTILTDYVQVFFSLKTPSGYNVMVPENPRRDDGMANVLLVRKETKEVQSFFDAVNTDDLVTYGDYVPYQGIATVNGTHLWYAPDILVVTAGTGGLPLVSGNKQVFSQQLPKGCKDYELFQDLVELNVDSDTSNASLKSNCKKVRVLHAYANNSYRPVGDVTNSVELLVGETIKKSVPKLSIIAGLVLINSEIHLRVCTLYQAGINTGFTSGSQAAVIADFRLQNRPLMKGV